MPNNKPIPGLPVYSRAHPESKMITNDQEKSRMITILNTIDYFSCSRLIFYMFNTVYISDDYGHMILVT